jgi:glucose/arabinose dehydrogenase
VVLKGGAVARGRLEGNQLRDVKVIWRQVPKQIGRGHFGGRLVFAPDGKLFITSGDRMRFDPAQDMTGNLGKIIRINPDGSIPADNPFVNNKDYQPDIWSAGHRNPLGAAINPATKKLWMHEMGPWNGDEINIPEAGKNYGWPVVSNGDNYDGSPIPDHPTRSEFATPAFYWHPAISPSGMIFYTGTLFKDWNGNVLLGGLSSESLIRLTLQSDTIKNEERIGIRKRIRDVIQAPDGSVWVLTDYKDGELLRLVPSGK